MEFKEITFFFIIGGILLLPKKEKVEGTRNFHLLLAEFRCWQVCLSGVQLSVSDFLIPNMFKIFTVFNIKNFFLVKPEKVEYAIARHHLSYNFCACDFFLVACYMSQFLLKTWCTV